MSTKFFQKIISVCLLATFLLPNIIFAAPVSDVANTAQSTISAVSETLGVIKEYGLDTLAVTLAQTISSKLANKIFNKANGGASGDSSEKSFITNFSDYFSNLSNQQVDKFVTELGISNNPYAPDIVKGLITSTQNLARDQSPLEAFNLDRVVGADWKEFATDASVGGWDGILALSNPANTNIGANILAQEEIARKIEQAKELEQIKLTSPGTRPQGKCSLDFKQYKEDINKIKQNRSNLGPDGKPITNDRATPSNPRAIPSTTNLGPDGKPVADDQNTLTPLQENVATSLSLAEDYGGCLQEMINNPVGLVTSGIDSALDQASDRLTQGDELGELIGGVLTTMLSTFIKSGLTALQADFQSNRGVGGPEQLVATNGQTIPWTQAPQTIIDLKEEFPGALSDTEKEVENLREYITKITETTESGKTYASMITQLDQCIPGPDHGYKKRLSAYVSKQTKRLEKRKDKGKNAKTVAKNNALENIDASLDAAKLYTDLFMNNDVYNIPGAGIMISQVKTIDILADRYQNAKSELTNKQITLNLLYSLESALQTNLKSIKQFIPGLPEKLVFTNTTWNNLSATEKNTLVIWSKTIANVPKEAPLTIENWNALSAAQKNTMINWAKERNNTEKPASVSDRDFVISITLNQLGISPNSASDVMYQQLVIQTTWNVWETPASYATAWDESSDVARNYLTQKNKIRSDYQGVQNDISSPYTSQKAETNLRQLESIIDETENMLNDCKTIRDVVLRNKPATITGNSHEQIKQILLTNKNRFKSQKIIDQIDNGNNILAKNPVTETNSFDDEYGKSSIITCENGSCYNMDINLLHPEFGYQKKDNDEPSEEELPDSAQKKLNGYQSQPAKNIWELVEKGGTNGSGDTAFCGFNEFLKIYSTGFGLYVWTPNPTLDGGKPIECSPEWYRIGPTEFRNILFKSYDDILETTSI